MNTARKSKNKTLVKKPLEAGKILIATMVVMALLVVGIEFIFDLKKNPWWYKAVLVFDISLVFAYFFLVSLRIINRPGRIIDLIRNNKADIAYLVVVSSLLFMPRLAAGMVVLRLGGSLLIRMFETSLGAKLTQALNLKPSQSLALSFLALIGGCSILLTFPAATVDGRGAKLLDAIFTMTAASCVAGLSVVDVGTYFTKFGQGIILFGVQAGGLGIMVLSASFVMLVGGLLPSRKQAGLSEVLDIKTPDGLRRLIRSVTASTIVMEFFGAIILFVLSKDEVPGFTDRVWWSVFHTVSAFCNCGLSLYSDSLSSFADNPAICFVFMALIISGGLGFFVFSDLTNKEVWEVKTPSAVWARLQIQSKVVIISTLLLNLIGMITILFLEFDGALHGLGTFDKIVAALFQAVNLRSSGFFTVPIAEYAGPTIIFSVVYMFIGAGPGSTGGGIKVTTAAISIMAVRSMLLGRQDVEVLGRRVSFQTVNRSLAIVLIAGSIIALFLMLLLASQSIPFEKIFFEVVSAFGTVGLSLNATSSLDNAGKILIICLMYVGRIGPLTLALAVGERRTAQGYRYPEGNIAVG